MRCTEEKINQFKNTSEWHETGVYHKEREYKFIDFLEKTRKEIAELEILIILLAQNGRRDEVLEIEMKNETEYYLQLTL